MDFCCAHCILYKRKVFETVRYIVITLYVGICNFIFTVRSVLESTTPQGKKSCCLFACLFLCVFPVVKNICYTIPCHYLRGLVQSNVSHSLEWPLHRKCTRLYYVIYILLLNWYEPHISWKLIWKLAQKRAQQWVKIISEGAFLIFLLMIYQLSRNIS